MYINNIMTSINKYRIKCVTDDKYEYVYGNAADNPPTLCPINTAHTIDETSTTIIETIDTKKVKVEEQYDGYFEAVTINMDIPTNQEYTTKLVSFPMNIILWKTEIYISDEMDGDVLNIIAAPDTIIGVITANLGISETTLNVNSTVINNIIRGLKVSISDGITKEDLGRVTAIDKDNSTITVETGPTHEYTAMTSMILLNIPVVNNYKICKENKIIMLGDKGLKGKLIPAGITLLVKYKNSNVAVAKKLNCSLQFYNLG